MSSNLKIKRICAWCGKEFIAQKTTTACCSKQCANALYKKKKRDEAIKANNQFVEKKSLLKESKTSHFSQLPRLQSISE